MSLSKPNPSAETLRAFTAGLADFVDSSDPVWSLLLNRYVALDARNLNRYRICEIFHHEPFDTAKTIARLTVEAFARLAANPALEDDLIPSSGWRFLALDGDVYGGCHVGNITPGVPPKLTGFSNDVQVLAAIEAFNGLDDVLASASITGAFELRVLRTTWLHFEAFWLHSLDGDFDRVIPYAGFPGAPHDDLALMQPFTAEEFFIGILPRLADACARSSAYEASVQDAKAKRVQSQASAQAAGLQDLQAQAKAEDDTAKAAFKAAAIAQVRANVNRATAGQIEVALGVTREEAEAIVQHRKEHKGFNSWESFTKVEAVDPNKLTDKEKLVGYGPKRAS
jgi:DNA uptake protein ComE-like DNA-binding protein